MNHGRGANLATIRLGRSSRAEAPSLPFTVRISPDERQRVDEAAKANHQTTSEFARDALVTAADDCLDDPTSVRHNARPGAS